MLNEKQLGKEKIMSKIVVVGSIAMDLVTITERVPETGETVFGEAFSMVPGGKGANQAVAIGRLAPQQVSMIGAVGQDAFGKSILDNFIAQGVLVDEVGTVPETTGVAQITLFEKDNRIIVIPGANKTVLTDTWTSEWETIKASQLVVLQNEIPHESNMEIAKYCQKNGIKVLYNPGPSRETDFQMLPFVGVITPNEHESRMLLPSLSLEEALAKYPNKLIVTLGAEGVLFHNGQNIERVSAIKAEVVDTTGAGDTFNGAFGFAVTSGLSVKEAIQFATIASHLSVQKFGAQGGMPTLEAIKEHERYEKTWHFE